MPPKHRLAPREIAANDMLDEKLRNRAHPINCPSGPRSMAELAKSSISFAFSDPHFPHPRKKPNG
jgi:hypothetical protein